MVGSGLIFTKMDRAGSNVLSSRLGLSTGALEVGDDLDFWEAIVGRATAGTRIDYLICDEAQFYTGDQVEQLARIVDEMDVDVFAFGITADFRTELFPGSKRLIELADRVQVLQVEALCWCGRRATTTRASSTASWSSRASRSSSATRSPGTAGVVEYEVLCRRHYMRRMTSHAARAAALSPEVLPFDLDVCPLPPLPITQAD